MNIYRQLKGGVIMDVVNPEQAKIAESAGAVAVMALERVPADIRTAGDVSPKRVNITNNHINFQTLRHFLLM